jgi:DNA-binding transcriptional MocR family regulator
MWTPRMEKQGAVYRQVLEAMERDIGSGALPPGSRLPPQRQLAFALGVSVGAVTRAYSEAERKGLVQGHVGRGTFVAGALVEGGPFALGSHNDNNVIDLARNRPPLGAGAAEMADVLSKMARDPGVATLLDYAPPAGFDEHRARIGGWMAELCGAPTADWGRLILCAGGQQAMAVAFGVLCRPGDTILCEALTYQGLKAISEQAGYRLCGLTLDEEGLAPEALEQALQRGVGKVLYVMPTLQNPTTRTMSAERRRAIADICRRYDAWIVEDDVYAGYAAPGAPPPLATFAPERTLYVNAGSKILAPGLRIGALLTPSDALFDKALRTVRAQTYAPSTFGAQVMSRWIADGVATRIADRLREEMTARTALALSILGEAVEPPSMPATLHAWLPMSELDAERVAGRALRAGVEVTPPAVPMTPNGGLSGIRLCLGAPTERSTLKAALEVVRAALSSEVGERSASFI